MSTHPIDRSATTPIYQPGFDLPPESSQNDSHRLEGLAEMMAFYADGAAHVGQIAKPSPLASEIPLNEFLTDGYVHFVYER